MSDAAEIERLRKMVQSLESQLQQKGAIIRWWSESYQKLQIKKDRLARMARDIGREAERKIDDE